MISNDEFELLKNSIGEFISIHSFISMKFDRPLSMSENFQGILFEIDLDPQLEHIKPFSMINSSEMLIMPGSIFRLIDIDKQCSIIRLKLSDENFQSIFNYTKNKIGYDDQQINLITLGNLLWKMDRLDEAEKYYLNLIDLVSSDQANLYYHLGHIYSDKNDYDLSLKYYQKSLDLWMKFNDSNLANNYNAIATIYWKQEDYKRAFESFNQALEIFKQIYGEDDLNVAMCLNNMGTIISNEKNYSKALNYYLKALNLFQKYLSINHPNLASLHCNISTMYKNLKQIDSALEHLNLSLNIYEQILPSNHSNISIMLKNIAFLYEQKKDFQQAMNCYKKISNIYQQTLASTDPAVIQNEEKIQLLLSK
jgi:tetratricopeptide (TPR) repeat protein